MRGDLELLRGELSAEGLAPAMIDEKAAEGLSKHIPPALILRACQQVAVRLRAARGTLEALELPVDDALLRALVDAQSVGATADALTNLGRQVRAPLRRERMRSTLVAVAAVAELGEREFLVEDALAAVGEALRHGGASAVRDLLASARTLRGSPSARGQSLRAQASHGRPESPGRSGSSHGNGPPHDVGYGQGRGRGLGMSMGMGMP
ncbi:MAG: hypothetical protein KC668_19565 [Myxococcales bacterium]|nr:hypothetical protein [Myxococcales bacterium]